jgi:multimeric flavodoxin WrbA
MKVIGIVGSPRKKGNTELLTEHVLKAISEEGLDTELIRLAGREIKPCNACEQCRTEERCAIEDDFMPIYLKMKKADGIILASPVYYGSASALIKALMERAGHIAPNHGEVYRGKVGGPLAVARRAGKNFTMLQLTLWFQILGFYIPGSTYWNVGIGREKGDIENDAEGLKTAWNFGKNIAFLVKKVRTDSV